MDKTLIRYLTADYWIFAAHTFYLNLTLKARQNGPNFRYDSFFNLVTISDNMPACLITFIHNGKYNYGQKSSKIRFDS